MRWLERGGVLQLFEVVVVGSVPHVHLRFERGAALFARFPGTRMPFIVVIPTQGKSLMVSAATVPGIREQDVLVLVVADPVLAALGRRQIARFTAESAAWLTRFPLCRGCHHHAPFNRRHHTRLLETGRQVASRQRLLSLVRFDDLILGTTVKANYWVRIAPLKDHTAKAATRLSVMCL